MTQLHHSTSADESVFYQLMRKYGENIYQQASRDRLTICIPPDDDVRQVGLMYASSTAKIQSFISMIISSVSDLSSYLFLVMIVKRVTSCEIHPSSLGSISLR